MEGLRRKRKYSLKEPSEETAKEVEKKVRRYGKWVKNKRNEKGNKYEITVTVNGR